MFKFCISRVTGTEIKKRWAYFIDDSDECRKFIKARYDIDFEEKLRGRWLVCSCDTCWTCGSDAFARYYRIIDVEKEEKKVTDSLYGETSTCAGMHAGECKCSTSKKPIEIKDQNFPVSISVSCSKENGFFMSVDFANDNKE